MEQALTNLSNSEVLCLDVRPPKNAISGFWQLSSAGLLFTLTAPIGALVQIDGSWIMHDGVGGGSTAVASGSPGFIYGMPLDGAVDQFLPVGLVTTT